MVHSIIIDELNLNTIIGVYRWERAIKQPLIVSAKIECDMSQAFFNDDVSYALDYKAVCEDIEMVCHQASAQLLENLAYKIITFLFNKYPCYFIELSLKKPNAIKHANSVGICIALSRDDYHKTAQ